MTMKMKVELLDHQPVSSSLKTLLSNMSFPDTLLICSNGNIILNRIMVGLIFPHLKNTFPFTNMSDVTLVLDEWSLEEFWMEVSTALGVEGTHSVLASRGPTNEETVHQNIIDTLNIEAKKSDDTNCGETGFQMNTYDEVDAIVSEIDAIQEMIKKSNKTETLKVTDEMGNIAANFDKSRYGKKGEISISDEDIAVMETDDSDEEDSVRVNKQESLNSSISDEVDELRQAVEKQEAKNKIIMEEIAEKNTAITLFENLEFAEFIYEKDNNDALEAESATVENNSIIKDRGLSLQKERNTKTSNVNEESGNFAKYEKELMLQKVVQLNMKFPSMTLTMAFIYNWCDDNLSPMVIKEGHANRYDHSNNMLLACPFGSKVENCPVMLAVIEDDGDYKISELNLEHKNHEISYRLYQQFKKPKEIKDIEADHRSIVEGLFKCGFTVTDVQEYFSGYNNSGVSLKDLFNLCAKIKQGVEVKALNHKCELCEEKFRTRNKLVNHMQLFHLVDMPITCKPCKVTSINRHEHKSHIENVHTQRTPCYECGKLIAKAGLTAHIETHMPSKETFPCHICDFQTNRRVNLEVHIAKHSEKKFKCKNCDKKFTWSSSMKSHMLAAHSKTNNAKFICHICTHEFKDGGNLKKHMFTHSQERPHNCDKCGKGWIRADFLKNHKCSATSE